ncbi:MAG: cobaltochelatase subunit CobN [Clostridia bacterium]
MFKIVGIIQGNHIVAKFNQVLENLSESFKKEVSFVQYEIYDIDNDKNVLNNCKKDLKNADFIFCDLHGGLTYFKSFIELKNAFDKNNSFYFSSGIDSEIEEMSKKSTLLPHLRFAIASYMEAGGAENYTNTLKFIANKVGKISCDFKEVSIPKWSGIYTKNHDDINKDEFIENIISQNKPIIGVWIGFFYYQNYNTRHIDTIIENIEKQGCVAYPVYSNTIPTTDGTYGGTRVDLEEYFIKDEKTVIDSLIVTMGYSLTINSAPGEGLTRVDTSVFEFLDVPIFQGMITNWTYEKWKKELVGLDASYLSINVYQPEFDGQIIGTVCCSTEEIETKYGVNTILMPIDERIEKLVKLAKNWAILRKIPMCEKKVAIILHNMPPRADMIGAAYGLDTPESVYNMYKALVENGLKVNFPFANGKEIIDRITDGLTNDGRFMSEEQMLEKADFVATKEDYSKWFSNYNKIVSDKITSDWGKAPGEFMVVDDKILVPGIVNKNLFVGLQPPRAFEEKAEECYHSTDMVCPWQYLAFYHYLENVYKANIIVHVGTHGSLEWLPGKEIALSQDCYPDLAIGCIPHVYPYIIDVPGEGAQAKRRSNAVILDHLIPSMKESGVYEDLEIIDNIIDQYHKAEKDDQNKLPIILKEICEKAEKANLLEDLRMTAEEFSTEKGNSVEKLHVWISEIKSSVIKDGLHTFGLPPVLEDDRMKNMLRLLTRVKNKTVLSLRSGIAIAKKLDIDNILDNPSQETNGKTNARLIEEFDKIAIKIFDELEINNYNSSKIDEVIANNFTKEEIVLTNELKKTLTFAIEDVLPRLEKTTDEIKNFIKAVNGEFVVPGPSGAPSRGNADILPTGRNFYMIDPSTIPSRASFEVGKTLANQMLQKHKEEHGEYPKNVAIIVYSGETIKTCGDDVSEILYLYGIKPVYLGETDRVIGLEVIPLKELGRPRIDVTLRISGLFRDTFPNLIELCDTAVNMVATLEEDDSQNFVRANILKDIKKFMDEGMSEELARDEASVRIFGCPPGTYGAGVDILVNSKKWETSDDLGQVYITWSGHAYSKNRHGTSSQKLLSHRLSNCTATIKNISSSENDMLDSDDFYNYHGGLISAVKKASGKSPESYSTNANDVSHITTKTVKEETARIMRARINNPEWIKGLQKHGYKGAQEFSSMFDIVFGWDATADVMENWMYDSLFDRYLNDEELREWIKKENKWALHAMSERLLEASQREMWDADEEKLEKLREIYMEMEGDFEG